MGSFTINIPFFIYPQHWIPGTGWFVLTDIMALHPTVDYTLTVNPDNGPGVVENTDYTAGFALLTSQGNPNNHIKVIGYVFTDYAARSLSAVQADIDTWYDYWPTYVKGIMLDEMNNEAGNEAYYTTLTNYVHNNYGADQLVMGNPGTSTIASYVNTVDVVMVAEATDYPSLATIDSATFNGAYSRHKFGVGIHSATVYNAPLMASFAQRAKYLHVTDDSGGNPYDTLSTWLSNMSAQSDKMPVDKRSFNALARSNNNIASLSLRDKA